MPGYQIKWQLACCLLLQLFLDTRVSVDVQNLTYIHVSASLHFLLYFLLVTKLSELMKHFSSLFFQFKDPAAADTRSIPFLSGVSDTMLDKIQLVCALGIYKPGLRSAWHRQMLVLAIVTFDKRSLWILMIDFIIKIRWQNGWGWYFHWGYYFKCNIFSRIHF